jgi:redox-sensitive bicupin YhaK (pirin superfamily)
MTTEPRIRPATTVTAGMPASDGAGVRLNRVVGTPKLPMVDPFLMLDEFRSDNPGDYLKGFPSHPHRGFETVTIMLAGAMEHKDSVGNTGRLGPGSVQWMTAGRGIIHSEMPKQEDGLMWGFQLWVNLPADAKMTPPRYQDLQAAEFETVEQGTRTVRVLAGTYAGITGPIDATHTQATLFDVGLQPGARFEHPLPAEHNVFVYVYEGSLEMPGHDRPVSRGHAIVLGEGDTVQVDAGDAGAKLMLFAGQPLNEPVVRYGPFVMNTQQQLVEAFEDYRAGRLAT